MAKDKTMKALLASIEAKEAEIARLQAGLDALREVYNAEAGIEEKKARAPRSNVKTAFLDLLTKVGSNGLNAHIACAMAKAEGLELQPKSVSSLLSRLKNDNILHHNGAMYMLMEYKPKAPSALPGADAHSVVRPLRTSG